MKTVHPPPEERQLLRLLSGQLPAAEVERLRARIAAEPALGARFERLSASWRQLELPPPTPAPAGYAQRLTVRATTEVALAPLAVRSRGFWLRALFALLVGLALGAGLGAWSHRVDPSPSAGESLIWAGVAESYWQLVGGESEGEGR